MASEIKRLDILEALKSDQNYIKSVDFPNKVANFILKKLKIERETSDSEAKELKDFSEIFCKRVRERWKKVKGCIKSFHIIFAEMFLKYCWPFK